MSLLSTRRPLPAVLQRLPTQPRPSCLLIRVADDTDNPRIGEVSPSDSPDRVYQSTIEIKLSWSSPASVVAFVLEDIEVTESHIQHVARRLQGSAGLDVAILLTGKISYAVSALHNRGLYTVSDLTRVLSNYLTDHNWFQFQALLSRRLIALDKSPGVWDWWDPTSHYGQNYLFDYSSWC